VIINAIGEKSIAYIKGVYQVYDIAFLDFAKIPQEPVRPQPLRNGLIGAGIGLLLSIFLVVVGGQLRSSVDALRKRLIKDPLSGAYTAAHFNRLIDLEISKSPVEIFSLGLISLDGIRGLVEELPDHVLRNLFHRVVEILNDQLRGNDEIGKWKNASFSLILKGTPGDPAARTFERIRQALAEPIMLTTGEKINLEPIIGLTCLKDEDITVNMLFTDAVHALDLARHSDPQTYLFNRSEGENA
jgi:diguanylate cyclase (GGDEF)-like protein